MSYNKLILFVIVSVSTALSISNISASGVPDQFSDNYSIVSDTIPIQDRDGDFINDSYYNPFDILPPNIVQSVEYDAKTDRYILTEKIGDEYYRPPTYMTFDEYMDWRARQDETEYFNSLSGITSKRPSLSGKLDPMDRIDVTKSLVDRMFGGTEVTIKPQGNVDLTLGLVDYRRTIGSANLSPQQARQLYIPGDFRIQPRLNVDGSIGEKLNLGFNYDANSTFDFDKKIKLDYSADAFNEDDIIKKLEAGNVSLPLNGSLIQGNQSLFGFKTEVQFGHLRLTGIMSQQRSRQNNLQIENGAAVQEFDITPNEYDENRHFFLSHFNRDDYERALADLPIIKTPFRIAQIEVWVTNTRREYQDRSTLIVGLSDLGEGDINNFHDPNTKYPPSMIIPDSMLSLPDRIPLPDNRQNGIYQALLDVEEANEIDKVARILSTEFGLKQTRDFDVFSGRLLNQSEYTYNEQLGYISLNFRLRPNEALAVSYKYYYTANCDQVYTVGQISSESGETSQALEQGSEPEAPKVIFTKLLKPVNQQTRFPTWDLMMKNVYNLRTSNLTRDGFTFDIYYEDDLDDGSLKKYIPLDEIDEYPLLNIFNLDNLNRFGDPQADGVFDFVPGVTVVERTGSIVFPILEPFGSHIPNTLKNDIDSTFLDSIFAYTALYDTTLAVSNDFLEKNKFIMRARVENATSGEINLGPAIPRGSVRVRAGGVTLVEGQDYEIDYSLGRLRVLNPAYLSQGTPINVSFEDNGAFNLNNKIMRGLRADYEFNDNFSIGATYLRLFERPFTQKVNIGDDPINNRIFGLDLAYNDELPWLTSAVDKLPFYSTKAPSSVAIIAEGAYLRPGHNKAINLNDEEGGVVSIDDFEGAISGFTLGGFNLNAWTFCSTPPEFAESQYSDSLVYGANRAKINWYQIDQSARSSGDKSDPYTRLINLQELFNRQTEVGQTNLFTFDISYYPEEKGIYNFDTPDGYLGSTAGVSLDPATGSVRLNDPESRWGGIMRSFQNPDFETANYEFIEFWVLNPFMQRSDGEEQIEGEEGEIVFNLGNVSEDIIKDDLQFYENGIPDSSETNIPIRNTNWGKVSLRVPITDGFDVNKIDEQDLGLDGMNDNEERDQFEDYLSNFPPIYTSIYDDPSGDNYLFYNDEQLIQTEPSLLRRFKGFNNPQGNAPINNTGTGSNNSFVRGNSNPESEDLNGNRTLDQAEAFWEYRLKLRNVNGEVDTTNSDYYREVKNITRSVNGQEVTEKWYRFQIPLTSGKAVGEISGFRSIQFMRMYMTKFQKAKTFRLVDFQLVRNLWRRSPDRCQIDGIPSQVNFSVDRVGVYENTTRRPFNYLIPEGIKQEIVTSTFGNNFQQDENSMVLKFEDMGYTCQVAVNKLARLNLTQYKKLQMFVHAEEKDQPLDFGDLSIFVKIGKDLQNNYYEYEMPLEISDIAFPSKEDNIWPDTNFISVELSKFLDVKKMKLAGTAAIGFNGASEIPDPDNEGAFIRVKGVPSLGLIKVVEVGVRNTSEDRQAVTGQVWVNELRCTGLEEKGGVAAQARMQIKMADLGEINLSSNYSSIGFGALDQRLQERSQEEILQYDAAATIQLGKLLPEKLKLNLPFYAQYSKSISNPRFDPYQLDLTTEEVLEVTPDEGKVDVRERARTSTTIKSYNFTNVSVDVGDGKMPWDPKNLSATYSWTETERTDPIIASEKEKETRLGLDYRYAMKPLYIQPFKFIKSKHLSVLGDFNFNLIPNNFSFNTNMDQFTNTKRFRLPDSLTYQFDDKRFSWDRNYNLDWDIAKSLRFTFKAQAGSIVDELRQAGIKVNPADRDWFNEFGQNVTPSVNDDPNYVRDYRNENIRNLGRPKTYNHLVSLSYRVPFKSIGLLDWISATADYKGQYSWTAGPLSYLETIPDTVLIGNVIQNNQTRSINPTLNFEKLYKKSKYLAAVENGGRNSRRRGSRSRTRASRNSKSDKDDKDANGRQKREKKERVPGKVERAIIRPFLALRTVKLSYREDLGTMIPGFMNETALLGLSNGFSSPGWDFAAGLQPDINKNNTNNWLQRNKGWFNPSDQFNEQLSQNQRHNINAKITLEPVKGFDIDIDFNKEYNRNHTEVFKAKDDEYMQLARYDVGGFEVTHFGLNTLFRDNVELLQQFKQNRVLASNLLPNDTIGGHPDGGGFAYGYGPLSYAANVPAFLAAYTGQEISSNNLNIERQIAAYDYIPKPNWQFRYNGLSKLKVFKDVFNSIQIKHGYKSTMGVSRFNTSPDFNENTQYSKLSANNNYYTEIEIPAVVIREQFSPLIGVSVKTKSDMSLNFEWKKSRNLNLNLQSKNLSEDLSNEMVFGFGYVFKDFKGFTSKKKKRTRRQKDEDKGDKKDGPIDFSKGGLITNDKGRTLTMNLDFSFRDNINLIYRLDDDTEGEPNRGQVAWSIEPSLEYQLYKNLALRWTAQYQKSRPYNLRQNGFVAFNTGITVRFNFN